MNPDLQPGVAFGLLVYAQMVDPVVARLLTRGELASIGDRRGPERAAAILAAKLAALRLNPSWELEDLEVVRRENAAPLLRIGGRQTALRLSVAHSDGLAVAAVTSDRRRIAGSGARRRST